MTAFAAERRLEELTTEVARKSLNGTLTAKFMGEAEAEAERLRTQIRNYKASLKLAGSASPNECGDPDPGCGVDYGPGFGGYTPGIPEGQRIMPVSMHQISKHQIEGLRMAALQKTSFGVNVGEKGLEEGFGAIRDKTVTASARLNLVGNDLPPIQMLGERGWFSLPFETLRVSNVLPNVAMTQGGASYFVHSGSGAQASYVAEGATKPDIQAQVSEVYVKAAKFAGMARITHELLTDASEFGGHLVNDLAMSLYNSESDGLLNGTVGTVGFNGINQISGTLSRAVASNENPIDTLILAAADLRSDFFTPEIAFIHPQTLAQLRKQRDANGRLQIDLVSGASGASGTNNIERLWGIDFIQTTQQAAGTCAMLSVSAGACFVFVRESLRTFYDPYTESQNNIERWIAETRVALAAPRPGAINLISGLPTS
jgi:Phage capsid family